MLSVNSSVPHYPETIQHFICWQLIITKPLLQAIDAKASFFCNFKYEVMLTIRDFPILCKVYKTVYVLYEARINGYIFANSVTI
jgi:hypothetical protein